MRITAINKKTRIALSAERLFGEYGFPGTSTQAIAKDAEVSEALIFKHFGTKQSLLEYLIKAGYQRILSRNRELLRDSGPEELIFSMIDLPNKLVTEEPSFWKMQYMLKDMPVARNYHDRFLKPVAGRLINAFEAAGIRNPREEARLFLLLMDALWKSHVQQGADVDTKLPAYIKSKYREQLPQHAEGIH